MDDKQCGLFNPSSVKEKPFDVAKTKLCWMSKPFDTVKIAMSNTLDCESFEKR